MRLAIEIARTDSPFANEAWCATLDSYEDLAVADLLEQLEDLE